MDDEVVQGLAEYLLSVLGRDLEKDIVADVIRSTHGDVDSAAGQLLALVNDEELTFIEGPSPLLDLPDDIMRHVCSFLTFDSLRTLASCCQQLREVVSEQWLATKSLQFSSCKTAESARHATGLIQRCPNIQSLSLKGSVWSVTIECVSLCSKNLKQLKLVSCDTIGDEEVHALLQGLPLLETLDLSRCPGITDDAFRFVQREAPNLRDLTLNDVKTLTDMGVGHLASVPLVSLSLSGCTSLQSNALFHALRIPSLESLNMSKCTQLRQLVAKGRPNLTHLNLSALLVRDALIECSELKTLNMGNCKRLTNFEIRCPKLETLVLSGSKDLRDIVGTSMPVLKSLNCFGCRLLMNGTVQRLVSECQNEITQVNLNGCMSVHELSLNCPNLQSLVVAGCKSLGSLDGACPMLKTIDLSGSNLNPKVGQKIIGC